MLHILVLGFYSRGNLGDEVYKIVIPQIFNNEDINFTFKCTDDIEEIPNNIDIIICGGGDIINPYFMDKILKLVTNYTKPIYAISVGIPYYVNVKYLNVFDHIFVRSYNDYKLAVKYYGNKNVDYTPDASLILKKQGPNKQRCENQKIKIGLCLAQPAFVNNPKKEELTDSIITVIDELLALNTSIYLISFNYNLHTYDECDFYLNYIIYSRIKLKNISADVTLCQGNDFYNPIFVKDFISTLDINICMRYHSVMFSLISNIPFVAIYTSRKIENVINDLNYQKYSYQLSVDNHDRPIEINSTKLINIIKNRIIDINPIPELPKFNNNIIKNIILKNKYKNVIVNNNNIISYDDIKINCKKLLCNYLEINDNTYDLIYNKIGKLNITQYLSNTLSSDKKYSSLDIARIICFAITGQINSIYIWGCAENMHKEDFILSESIKYIYEDYYNNFVTTELQYYPKMNNIFKRKTFIDMNCVFQDDFKSLHRSGWNYVINGLMNIDASQFSRKNSLLVDVFVDRTFHWGCDPLLSMGMIPYKRPWVGFIHHTFSTESDNNCVLLFKNPAFIASLQQCKGLILLSQYLADQVQIHLKSVNYSSVPVYVLCHPMESVENLFTIDKFKKNNNKKIMQIGAWMRKSYSIYELNLYNNPLNLSKVALKGKCMENYFKPTNFIEHIEKFFIQENNNIYNTEICRDNRPCRPNTPCRPSNSNTSEISNKYLSGLLQLIKKNDESVQILDKVNNEEYDTLLSENIVFLNLEDCSAVNTVLECIVRNTPVIVNKHPALIEVLGEEYPGFYDGENNYLNVYNIISKIQNIENITKYLEKLDKSKFDLEFFMNKFQDIVLDIEKNL